MAYIKTMRGLALFSLENMRPRFTCASLITKLNRPFRCPPHFIVCNWGNSVSNFSTIIFSDSQKLTAVQAGNDPTLISGIPFTSNINYRGQVNSISLCRRAKHTKSKKPTSQEEDEDEEDYFATANDEESHQGKTISMHVASLRVDVVLKSGLGLSRNKVEEYFYQSRVRVNEEKVMKKSTQAMLNDYIDIVRGINSNSDRYIDVMRIHIVGIRMPKDPQSKLELKVKRDKLLTVQNYTNAWSGVDISL